MRRIIYLFVEDIKSLQAALSQLADGPTGLNARKYYTRLKWHRIDCTLIA